ncbi:MAG TPA: OmpA family protein [Pseudonocardiaceae bacterium]|nr:OmpA family protein [Pseudonocardiaceae bacterium]
MAIDVSKRKFAPLLVPLACVTMLASCSLSAGSAGGDGDQVVIVVSGTANEPKPTLTQSALDVLVTAANSTNVGAGADGRSSLATVSSADGTIDRSITLTPRRADGSVEHGLSRQSLINQNVRDVTGVVASVTATRPGLDLLNGVSAAVRGVHAGTLIVVSNGLSTSGGLDLRQVGWNADPATVAKQLAARDLLPKLAGWHVLFTGLGAVAGDQPPLPDPQLDTLTRYWQAICRAAGALSCEIDQSRIPAVRPMATVATPVVPVPDVTSVVGPNGQVNTTVSDGALGFAGNSAALTPPAHDLLSSIADSIVARLAARPGAAVTVTGYAADPPGSTDQGRTALALLRAKTVAAALATDGVTEPISVAGIGTQQGVTAMINGQFDEQVASTMRRVVITY